MSLDQGEVGSYNLTQICSIFVTIKECNCASVHLSICPCTWILESSPHFDLKFVLVIIKLGTTNLKGGPLGSLLSFFRSKYVFDMKGFQKYVFLYSIPFRPLAVNSIVWLCFVGPLLFPNWCQFAYFIIIFNIIHSRINYTCHVVQNYTFDLIMLILTFMVTVIE